MSEIVDCHTCKGSGKVDLSGPCGCHDLNEYILQCPVCGGNLESMNEHISICDRKGHWGHAGQGISITYNVIRLSGQTGIGLAVNVEQAEGLRTILNALILNHEADVESSNYEEQGD